MKAAVLHQYGQAPRYEDFPDPVPENEQQLLVTMKAASIKNLDKSRASGTHYSSLGKLPALVGVDGVGLLADGTRIYAMGLTGMIAEKALVDTNKYVKLPEGISDADAAALPNIVIGASLALCFRAGMAPGKTVLINGATGVTGKAAIQIAKCYGAAKVIATGRNAAILSTLPELGADDVISLKDSDEAITLKLKEIHAATPIDIVIDYTWGHPAELILHALKGGGLHHISHSVKFVTVGSMAGDNIHLSSGLLRSSAIEVLGSGFGSLSKDALRQLNTVVLPEAMQWMAEGKIKIDTEMVPLKDVEAAWNKDDNSGKRLVVIM